MSRDVRKRSKRKTSKTPGAPRTPQRSAIARWIGHAAAAEAGLTASDQTPAPFWETKRIDELTPGEWESLCDGCGQCCLLKLEDEDTGDVYLTRLACRLLDVGRCRCKDYENRHAVMPDCLTLGPDTTEAIAWLPESCGYRRVAEGRGLAWWHPLVSGDPETVHQAGVSVRDWAVAEDRASARHIAHYIIGEVG